jgi:hypothetical protein
LKWRSAGGEIPRNQDFAMDVLLEEGGRPVSGAQINLRGWMPDHGHGFVRQPLVMEKGDGLYRLEGVLLHMRGKWQLFFDVTKESSSDVVSFELELP